ncbi:hypothetical protein CLAIMM_09957 isoform 2, partial [Cladophialophora immunda]
KPCPPPPPNYFISCSEERQRERYVPSLPDPSLLLPAVEVIAVEDGPGTTTFGRQASRQLSSLHTTPVLFSGQLNSRIAPSLQSPVLAQKAGTMTSGNPQESARKG